MSGPLPEEKPLPAPPPAAQPGLPSSDTGQPPAKPALTPEEQMEKFAEALKETDWGHQPC